MTTAILKQTGCDDLPRTLMRYAGEHSPQVNLCPTQDEKFAPNTRLPSAPCQLSVVRSLEKNPKFCYCMKLKYMLQTSTEVKAFAYHIGHLLSREGT